MHKVKYNRHEYRTEYLRSKEWKSLRETILSTECTCQICKQVEATDVHHFVYRNLVDVTVSDLLPVCRKCHNQIHKAIDSGWISQKVEDIEDIKKKTLNILLDEEYQSYMNWYKGKHFLEKEDVQYIKVAQPYVIKKISAVVRKNVWFDTIEERKFTGKQILIIKKILQMSKYRKQHNNS